MNRGQQRTAALTICSTLTAPSVWWAKPAAGAGLPSHQLKEWFLNGRRGLEHSFTLRQRPAGTRQLLTLLLSIRGGLRPRLHPGRQGRELPQPDGTSCHRIRGIESLGHRQQKPGFLLAGCLRTVPGNRQSVLTLERALSHYQRTASAVTTLLLFRVTNCSTPPHAGGTDLSFRITPPRMKCRR